MAALSDLVTKQISDDLVWRESELATMRKQLVSAPIGSVLEAALIRANLSMIYAHYEGFCKLALELYTDALGRLNIQRKNLKWPLASYSMKQFRSDLASEQDHGVFFTRFLDGFNRDINDIASFEKFPQISNLWPNLLLEWLQRLDLDSSCVTAEFARLDTLVNTRNQIAHGKKLMITDRAEVDKYAHSAQLAMHEVAIGVSEALEKKLYIRNSIVYTIMHHAT